MFPTKSAVDMNYSVRVWRWSHSGNSMMMNMHRYTVNWRKRSDSGTARSTSSSLPDILVESTINVTVDVKLKGRRDITDGKEDFEIQSWERGARPIRDGNDPFLRFYIDRKLSKRHVNTESTKCMYMRLARQSYTGNNNNKDLYMYNFLYENVPTIQCQRTQRGLYYK